MTDFKMRVERESHVEDAVIAWAENNGWVARMMSYRGRNGCPDVFFFGYGAIVPIEFKRPGGELRASQVREHKRLAAVGVEIPVYSVTAAAIGYLRQFMP